VKGTSNTVCSVPRGSVFGPHLFVLYEAHRAEVIKNYDVNIQAFADDTQLYRHCLCVELAATVLQLERYCEEVSHWMSANRYRLNADKMELLLTGSKYSQSLLGSKGLPLQIDTDTVTAFNHVRVLGVTFSADLSLDKHVCTLQHMCIMFFLALPTSTSSMITRR